MPSLAHTPNRKIRLLIADMNLMSGQLIAGALRRCRDKFEVLGSTDNCTDALRLLMKCPPDVAVISTDLQDGPLTGLKLLHQLRASGLKVAAVMMMDDSEREVVIGSFRGGARGVFCRRSPLKRLSKCIRAVHNGELWISNNQIEFFIEFITRLKPLQLDKSQGMKLLTKREAEVVGLVAQGMRNSEIALELHVAEHTVRNYLFRIFEKLGVSSRVELVLHTVTRQENDQADSELELRR